MMEYINWKLNAHQRLKNYFFDESDEYISSLLNLLLQHVYGKRYKIINDAEFKEHLAQLEYHMRDIINLKMPIQYTIGSVAFLDADIFVEPPTLIPRPETEYLMYYLISWCKENNFIPKSVIDAFCGTGCMGISLLKEFSESICYGIDIEPNASALAQKNALHSAMSERYIVECCDAIDWMKNKLIHSTDKYDIILANPPYISQEDYYQLPPFVTKWEDVLALTDFSDGAHFLYNTIEIGLQILQDNGILFLECDKKSYEALLLRNEKKKVFTSGTIIYDQYELIRGIMIKKDEQ